MLCRCVSWRSWGLPELVLEEDLPHAGRYVDDDQHHDAQRTRLRERPKERLHRAVRQNKQAKASTMAVVRELSMSARLSHWLEIQIRRCTFGGDSRTVRLAIQL